MQKKKRILIADLDHDLITRLAFSFEDKGYETTSAWSGHEALEQLHCRQFDVVLLSAYLPDVGHAEVWGAIRRLPSKPAVALLESAQSDPEMVKKYLDLGGHCIVSERSAYLIAESVHKC